MSDQLQERWFQIACSVVTALVAWLLWHSLEMDKKHYGAMSSIQGMQFQIEALAKSQTNTIPPVVEASLREIREKGNMQSNADREAIAKLTETAIKNAQDIGYLKQEISKIKP